MANAGARSQVTPQSISMSSCPNNLNENGYQQKAAEKSRLTGGKDMMTRMPMTMRGPMLCLEKCFKKIKEKGLLKAAYSRSQSVAGDNACMIFSWKTENKTTTPITKAPTAYNTGMKMKLSSKTQAR
jgi:hypothetical protein